jgi:hypothetical protein
MQTWAAGVFDRAVRTGLQTLLAYLSVAKLINEVAWLPALSATGFAVALSLITSVIGSPSFGAAYAFQLLERAVKTFLQSTVAFIGTTTMFDQVDWKTGFSAAALATVYSVVTSVLTTRAGSADTIGQVDLTSPHTARSAHLQPA